MRRRPDKIDQHVATRIRKARMDAGHTQTVLGAALKITFQQIQKYESGANRISASTLYRMASFLDKPMTWFFE